MRAFGSSLRHAWDGIVHAVATQWNMRVHLAAAALALAAAFAFHLRRPAVLAIVLVIALVLALELVNTAVEALVDLISPESHPLARIAKDCAAGAVLVAALAALAVGFLAFTAP